MTIIVSCHPSTQRTNTTCMTQHHWGILGDLCELDRTADLVVYSIKPIYRVLCEC